MKYFLAIFSLSFFLLSCTAKKKIVDNSTAEENVETSMLLDSYTSNVLSYGTAEFTADMDLKSPALNVNFVGTFRMTKDKEIWGSFKKFGFEAARVKITPDSIFILNRFQKEAIVDGMDKIQAIAGVPVTFQDLEQLLVGGSFYTDGLVMANDSTLSQSRTIKGNVIEALHFFNSEMEIQKSQVNAQNQGDIEIEYSAHQVVNDTNLAFRRDIMAQSSNAAVNLRIETTNFDLESSFETPFSIPANYSRRTF